MRPGEPSLNFSPLNLIVHTGFRVYRTYRVFVGPIEFIGLIGSLGFRVKRSRAHNVGLGGGQKAQGIEVVHLKTFSKTFRQPGRM